MDCVYGDRQQPPAEPLVPSILQSVLCFSICLVVRKGSKRTETIALDPQNGRRTPGCSSDNRELQFRRRADCRCECQPCCTCPTGWSCRHHRSGHGCSAPLQKNNPGGRSLGGENERPTRVSQGVAKGGSVVSTMRRCVSYLHIASVSQAGKLETQGTQAFVPDVNGGVVPLGGKVSTRWCRRCLVSVPDPLAV